MDSRGRVTIRPEYRDRLGSRFVQVLMPDGVHLVPIPAKKTWLHKLPAAKDARRLAEAAANEEIDEELESIHGVKRARKR